MSTEAEKSEAVRAAIDIAKKRLKSLEDLKTGAPEYFKLNKAKQYELDMTIEVIRRGELLLSLSNPTTKPAEEE